MIILVTERDKNRNEVVSHGIDEETGRNVVLPWMPPSYFGAVFDRSAGYWVILDKKEQ